MVGDRDLLVRESSHPSASGLEMSVSVIGVSVPVGPFSTILEVVVPFVIAAANVPAARLGIEITEVAPTVPTFAMFWATVPSAYVLPRR